VNAREQPQNDRCTTEAFGPLLVGQSIAGITISMQTSTLETDRMTSLATARIANQQAPGLVFGIEQSWVLEMLW
jgi:hypothetical protein